MTQPSEDLAALLACPFPHEGGDLLEGSWPAKHQYWVHCPCGAMGPICNSPEAARERWNTRARTLPAAPAEWQRKAAEEIREAVVALSWASDGDFVPGVMAILARHTPGLDAWQRAIEAAAKWHNQQAFEVESEHPGIQGSNSQKRRRNLHLKSAEALRALSTVSEDAGEETVARALAKEDGCPERWDDGYRYIHLARAAIRAMRDGR